MNLMRLKIAAILCGLIGAHTIYSDNGSALTIKNGEPTVDFPELKLEGPYPLVVATGGGAAVGGIVGAVIGAWAAVKTNEQVGPAAGGLGILGILIGAGIAAYKNNNYRNYYNASGGYNIFGVAAKDNVKGIDAAIKYGVKPMVMDGAGRVPLHFAAATDSAGATKELLSHMPEHYRIKIGSEVGTAKTTTNPAWGVLDAATGKSYYKAPTTTTSSKTIYSEVPAIDVQDKQGNTAAHLAAKTGSVGSFKVIMQAGANGNVPNKAGQTVVKLAEGKPALQLVFTKLSGD